MSRGLESVPAHRLRLAVRGAVQGVGFRPFVYRLATELGLSGWVHNSPAGVFAEVEGARPQVEQFRLRIESEKPPHSFIQSLECSWLDAAGYSGFEIRPSNTGGAKTALILPDIATCPDCLREIFDPADRRHNYPFTNCTRCGPRFSIIEALPYDRANTSMKQFHQCPACEAEYNDPANRRFHAQPNACPVCGPRLELWDRSGHPRSGEPLDAAAAAIASGKIVAVKGLGGFHLFTAAENEEAIAALRMRKQREEKPFAVMFPSLAAVQAVCEVSLLEERLLRSAECPIVLLRRRQEATALPRSIAPGNPYLGALLPYTPLHHLLLARVGAPVIATSGNLSDEPICIDEHEALERLEAIGDLFLVHNRPIVRHVDDSITRIMGGRELVLRRARGYAPLPIPLREQPTSPTVLGTGPHLKNTVALAIGSQAFLSQHIGDLETDLSFAAFEQVIADFQRTFETTPEVIAADVHPDYLSSQYARRRVKTNPALRLVTVQHHLAHVLSCMAENDLQPPLLGVSWDGTGYGLDGTVWGGEFFLITNQGCRRVAHFRPFRLPGGDAAVKEPRRAALGLLHAAFGDRAFAMPDLAPVNAFTPAELASVRTMLERGLNSPWTTSAGRLFDAVAALAGGRQRVRFEGQAAMELEFAAENVPGPEAYTFGMEQSEVEGAWQVNWAPMLKSLLDDLRDGLPVARIAARLHHGMAEAIVSVARLQGEQRVVLSGGCFQNRLLTESAIHKLQANGFRAYWHQRVPPNDGGIALGQVVAARSNLFL